MIAMEVVELVTDTGEPYWFRQRLTGQRAWRPDDGYVIRPFMPGQEDHEKKAEHGWFLLKPAEAQIILTVHSRMSESSRMELERFQLCIMYSMCAMIKKELLDAKR